MFVDALKESNEKMIQLQTQQLDFVKSMMTTRQQDSVQQHGGFIGELDTMLDASDKLTRVEPSACAWVLTQPPSSDREAATAASLAAPLWFRSSVRTFI